jgi:uncharacterized membrane protein affecting hemolysin expression
VELFTILFLAAFAIGQNQQLEQQEQHIENLEQLTMRLVGSHAAVSARDSANNQAQQDQIDYILERLNDQ